MKEVIKTYRQTPMSLDVVLIDKVRKSYRYIFGEYLVVKFLICCCSLCDVFVSSSEFWNLLHTDETRTGN